MFPSRDPTSVPPEIRVPAQVLIVKGMRLSWITAYLAWHESGLSCANTRLSGAVASDWIFSVQGGLFPCGVEQILRHAPSRYRNLAISTVEVKDVHDQEVLGIEQHDVPADHHMAAIAWRRRQATLQIFRTAPHLLT